MCRGLAFDEHAYREAGSPVPHRIPITLRRSYTNTHTAPAPRVTYTPALVIEPLYFRTRDDRTTGPAYTIRMQIRGGPAAPADPHAAARA